MDSLRTLALCLPLALCHWPQIWRAAWQFWPPISVLMGAQRSLQRDGAAIANEGDKDPMMMRMTAAGKEGINVRRTLEGHTLYLLIGVAALVVAIALFGGLFEYLAAFCLNRAGRTIVRDLRAALFDHIQKVSLQFHSRRPTGDLISR